jgi:hypothetical protein
MDKRGRLIAENVSFNKYLIIVAVVVIAFLGVTHYLSTGKIISADFGSKCPKNIAPERIYASCSAGLCKINGNEMVNAWKDSTEISSEQEYPCYEGRQRGENTDYIYCKNLVFMNETSGSEYKIDMVLDSQNYTKILAGDSLIGSAGSSSSFMDFLIVSYECEE